MNCFGYRHPRTTAERRAALCPELLEFGIFVRAKRSWALPNAWDDRPVGRERSWKAHRASQYKA